MPLETVRIKIESDAKLDPTIEKLEQMGKVDAKNAEQFKKNNEDYKKAQSERQRLIEQEMSLIKDLEERKKKAYDPDSIRAYNDDIKKAKDNVSLLKNEQEKLNGSVSGLVNNFKNLAGALGIAFATQQIVSFGKEAVQLAAKGEGIRAAFAKIGDDNTLNKLREATRGAVSDLELMQAALRAKNFNINTDLLAKGLEFAGKVARQTGQDVNYLTNSFVDGLGRKSIRILDNLQISQVDLQKEVKKTGDFNIAVGNLIDERLVKMGNVTETNADKIARWSAELENSKEVAGVVLNFILNGLQDSTEASDKFNDSLNKNPFIAKGIFKNISKQTDEELKASFESFTAIVREQNKKLIDIQNNSFEAQQLNKIKEEQQRRINEKKAAEAELEAKKKLMADLRLLTIQELEDLGTDEAKDEIKRRKRIEEQNKQIEELTKIGIKSRIEAMRDGLDKSLAVEDERHREELAKLKAIIPLTVEAERLKHKAIENEIIEHNKKRVQLQENAVDNEAKARIDREDKYQKDFAKKQEDLDKEAKARTERESKYLSDFKKKSQKEELKDQKEHEKRKQAIIAEGFDVVKVLLDSFYNYQRQVSSIELEEIRDNADARIAAIDRQQAAEEEKGKKLSAEEKAKLERDKKFEAQRQAIRNQQAAEERKVKTEQFEREKQASIINALIDGAEAVISSLKIDPTGVLGAIVGAQAAIQIGFIQAQPTPKFEKGGKVKGRLHSEGGVLIEAERDEWIINRKMSQKYDQEMKAANEGNLEKLIYQKYQLPIIQKMSIKEAQQTQFAESLAKAIQINGGDDSELLHAINNLTKTEKANAQMIAKAIKERSFENPYRF